MFETNIIILYLTVLKENFVLLTQELKVAFQPFGFLLTAAVSAGQVTIDIAYDIPRLSANLDFINVSLLIQNEKVSRANNKKCHFS